MGSVASSIGGFFADLTGLSAVGKDSVANVVAGLQQFATTLDDTAARSLRTALPRVDEVLGRLRGAEFQSDQWRTALDCALQRVAAVAAAARGDLKDQADRLHKVINQLQSKVMPHLDTNDPRGVFNAVHEALQDARAAFASGASTFSDAVAWSSVFIEHAETVLANMNAQIAEAGAFCVEVLVLLVVLAALLRNADAARLVPVVVALWMAARLVVIMFVPIEVPRDISTAAVVAVVALAAAACVHLPERHARLSLWLAVAAVAVIVPLSLHVGPTAATRAAPPVGLCPRSVLQQRPYVAMKLLVCNNSDTSAADRVVCVLNDKTVSYLMGIQGRIWVTTGCGPMGTCKSTLLTTAVRTLGNTGCWNRAHFSSAGDGTTGGGVTLGADVIVVPRPDGDYELFVDTEGLGDLTKHVPSQVALASFASLLSDRLVVHCAGQVNEECANVIKRILQGRDWIRGVTQGGINVSLPQTLNMVVVEPRFKATGETSAPNGTASSAVTAFLTALQNFDAPLHAQVVAAFPDIQVRQWRHPRDADRAWLDANDRLASVGVPASDFFDDARAIRANLRPALTAGTVAKTIGAHRVTSGELLAKWIVLVSKCLNGDIPVLTKDVVEEFLCRDFVGRMQQHLVAGKQHVLARLPVGSDAAVEKLWQPADVAIRALSSPACSATTAFVQREMVGVVDELKRHNAKLHVFTWHEGKWSDCHGDCPTGTTTHTVECQRGDGAPASDAECTTDIAFNGTVLPGTAKPDTSAWCAIPSPSLWVPSPKWSACRFDSASTSYVETRELVCKDCGRQVPESQCANAPVVSRTQNCGSVNPLVIVWVKLCSNGKHLTGLWFRRHNNVTGGTGHGDDSNCVDRIFGAAHCIRSATQRRGVHLGSVSLSSRNGHVVCSGGEGDDGWHEPVYAGDGECLVDVTYSCQRRECGPHGQAGHIIDAIDFHFGSRKQS